MAHAKRYMQAFGKELPQQQAAADLHSLCEGAKEKAVARNQSKTAEASQQEGFSL